MQGDTYVASDAMACLYILQPSSDGRQAHALPYPSSDGMQAHALPCPPSDGMQAHALPCPAERPLQAAKAEEGEGAEGGRDDEQRAEAGAGGDSAGNNTGSVAVEGMKVDEEGVLRSGEAGTGAGGGGGGGGMVIEEHHLHAPRRRQHHPRGWRAHAPPGVSHKKGAARKMRLTMLAAANGGSLPPQLQYCKRLPSSLDLNDPASWEPLLERKCSESGSGSGSGDPAAGQGEEHTRKRVKHMISPKELRNLLGSDSPLPQQGGGGLAAAQPLLCTRSRSSSVPLNGRSGGDAPAGGGGDPGCPRRPPNDGIGTQGGGGASHRAGPRPGLAVVVSGFDDGVPEQNKGPGSDLPCAPTKVYYSPPPPQPQGTSPPRHGRAAGGAPEWTGGDGGCSAGGCSAACPPAARRGQPAGAQQQLRVQQYAEAGGRGAVPRHLGARAGLGARCGCGCGGAGSAREGGGGYHSLVRRLEGTDIGVWGGGDGAVIGVGRNGEGKGGLSRATAWEGAAHTHTHTHTRGLHPPHMLL